VSVEGDTLAPDDLALLARMHLEALPGSLVSLAGEAYARAFYRYVAASAEELILVERAGRDLVGACVVSLAPATLSRRLLLHTRLPLVMHRLPLAKLALGLLRPAKGAPPAQPEGPEILLVFAVPERRSSGVGARLLARTQALLAARGHLRLLVKTRDEATNRALGFYAREGFRRVASLTKLGKRLVLFEKPLA
jgi:GNAT superfamily N-acetyltransferase